MGLTAVAGVREYALAAGVARGCGQRPVLTPHLRAWLALVDAGAGAIGRALFECLNNRRPY